jgi:catalase
MQANQTVGNGFFTSPDRFYSGNLVREQSPTFNDHYTQPRLFWNSLVPEEQQMIVNALRFEISHVTEPSVIQNVVNQLNMVDNDLACRVGAALAIPCPAPNPTYYHNNMTVGVSAFQPLYNISGLQVAFLASEAYPASLTQGMQLAESLASAQVDVTIIAETLQNANVTYSAADGSLYDAVIVADGVQNLFSPSSFTKQPNSTTDMPMTVSPYSSLFPAGRPLQILVDAFKYGKTVGALGSGRSALATAGITSNVPGVYFAQSISSSFISDLRSALTTFKWLNRFTLDSN